MCYQLEDRKLDTTMTHPQGNVVDYSATIGKKSMHPLNDNLKSISFEELEKRSQEIIKRMQTLRRMGNTNQAVWNQLDLLLESINNEKSERAAVLNSPQLTNSQQIVVSTDPLEDDQIIDKGQNQQKKFSPIT